MRTGLVLFLCGLVLGKAAVIPNDCHTIDVLNGKLLYDNRVTYMYEYFPTDYKLQVKYEEVLRCQNITALINKGITVKELRYLWGIINYRVLSKMQAVLPLRHPSLSYVTELQLLFHELQKEQEVESDVILEILERLDRTEVKSVSPKALLDNCFRVLYALYEDECKLCNPSILLAL
ncbi:interleukin-34 isoform X2 [Pseudophryne corroboree]|uniref:interleukin-34 isoform X2 n=1 Tax=Pseudophryne corroboree TaxID=495146 RepID=UPI00308148CD